MLRYEHIISIFSACHKKSTKNTLSPYKNKMHNIHVRGEIVLFYFSTLKLKYFTNLSFQSAVYDKKHHISTKMCFIVCLLEERFVTFWAFT